MHIKKKSINDLKDILLDAKYKNLIKDVIFYEHHITICFYQSEDLQNTVLSLQNHIKNVYYPIQFFYTDVTEKLILEIFHFENFNTDQNTD